MLWSINIKSGAATKRSRVGDREKWQNDVIETGHGQITCDDDTLTSEIPIYINHKMTDECHEDSF